MGNIVGELEKEWGLVFNFFFRILRSIMSLKEVIFIFMVRF